MGFMRAELIRDSFAYVETERGESWHVPADCIPGCPGVTYKGRRGFYGFERQARLTAPEHVWGMRDDRVKRIIVRDQWASRLSAPGYLDCTDWNVAATPEAALEALQDQFGDDCETADELAQIADSAGVTGFEFTPCDWRECSHCHGHEYGETECEGCFQTLWYVTGSDELPESGSFDTEREARDWAAHQLRTWRHTADGWNEDYPSDDPRYVYKVPAKAGGGWEYVRPDRCDNLRMLIRSERVAR